MLVHNHRITAPRYESRATWPPIDPAIRPLLHDIMTWLTTAGGQGSLGHKVFVTIRENQVTFQPGVSGNPAGRPIGSGKSVAFMELLHSKMPLERLFEEMDNQVFELHDPKATMYMIDRHLGRPAQAIMVSGDAERPLHALIGVEPRQLGAPETPQDDQQRLAAPIEGDGAVRIEEE